VSTRQYGRDDVVYADWYNPWMKLLAKSHTVAELQSMLHGASAEAVKHAGQHLRAIQKTGSMTGNSAARAHSRNNVAASGDKKIALQGALEIHELFPEHAKQSATGAPA